MTILKYFSALAQKKIGSAQTFCSSAFVALALIAMSAAKPFY